MKTHYGIYGGQYIAETLMTVMYEVETSFKRFRKDRKFKAELQDLLQNYVGRATPLYHAAALSRELAGAQIYLKREDLNHTGAHKINNALGQALLAKYMGKTKLIAETGAGMHGVATATAAALLGMECQVFMGSIDIARQSANVGRMRVLGTTVISVESGSCTLKDAMNEALRYYVAHSSDTFYVIGTAAGPYPYPEIVKHFQSVIGHESRKQILKQHGSLPVEAIACVGGGSNAIGLFAGFLKDSEVGLIGVEAAGKGLDTPYHAASINGGRVGVLHGSKSYLLQNEDGQILETHSISAGLDYPGVGPEHCFLADCGRAEYIAASDQEALEAFKLLCRTEGIIPALESSHAIAAVVKRSKLYDKSQAIVVCLSGRGDKDLHTVLEVLK